MPAPFDYSFDVANPLDSAVSAYRAGLGMRNAGIASRDEEQKAVDQARAREQALKDAEFKHAKEVQFHSDVSTIANNPNAGASDFSSLIVKYPEKSEGFKRAWEVKDKGRQADDLSFTSQAYAAASAGRVDIVTDLMTKRATALRNGGDEKEAKVLEDLLELVKFSPESAKTTLGIKLASVMDPDKFAETFAKLEGERRTDQEQPVKIEKLTEEAKKARAEADTAATAARFAESNAVKDLEKKGWDIDKLKSDIDIAKANTRIAAMNADIGKEANQLKRDALKLKRDEAVLKRDDALRAKTANVEEARATTDNALNNIDRLLANNSLNDVVGSMEGRLPAVISDEAADAIELINTLKSEVFLTELQKMKQGGASGLGSLTEREGDKLERSLQSLSRVQSETQFKAGLNEIKRLLLKARGNLAARHGIPDTIADTPDAKPAEGQTTDDILRELGVLE